MDSAGQEVKCGGGGTPCPQDYECTNDTGVCCAKPAGERLRGWHFLCFLLIIIPRDSFPRFTNVEINAAFRYLKVKKTNVESILNLANLAK